MEKYRIVTDSTSDLPLEYVEKNKLGAYPLKVHIGNDVFDDDLGRSISFKDFYNRLRAGETASTSQLNPNDFLDSFGNLLREGFDIFYIAFSSALSGCYNSAVLAREELLADYPDRRIAIIDSLSASLGEGYLVDLALEKQAEGASFDELCSYVEGVKLKVVHLFTVDDLHHLQRGGRISHTSAALGSLMGIKPILHVNDEGKLAPVAKIRGRNKALETIASKIAEQSVNPGNNKLFISHGDCIEDVNLLIGMVKAKVSFKEIMVNFIGPVIGAHAGQGTIAVFFLAENRTY